MRIARLALFWGLAAVMAASGVGIAVSADAAPAATYTTTANLNVRSGPSTSTTIIATVKKGTTLAGDGAISKGWLPITYNSKKAYVSADYIKATSGKTPSTGSTQTKVTTVNVNLRAQASLTSSIVKVLMKGTTVTVTGTTSNGFTQVVVGGTNRWVYTTYLTDPAKTLSSTSTTSAATSVPASKPATAVTTSALQQRATASYKGTLLATVPKGATLSLSGKSSGSYSQATYKSKTGWVLTGYFTLKSAGTTGMVASKLPVAKKLVYVNATDVNLRAGASSSSAKITEVDKPTPLAATGTTKNGYTAVIWDAQVRWIASEYVGASASTTPTVSTLSAKTIGDLGSSSLNKLQSYGKAAVVDIREHFPKIKTIYGWRASSAYSSDHPSGRAIDIMIPSYKSNEALGDSIATYVINNASRLHVKYVIWQQRYYAISAGKWTKMADRGSDTQNHYDHVHVSFYNS